MMTRFEPHPRVGHLGFLLALSLSCGAPSESAAEPEGSGEADPSGNADETTVAPAQPAPNGDDPTASPDAPTPDPADPTAAGASGASDDGADSGGGDGGASADGSGGSAADSAGSGGSGGDTISGGSGGDGSGGGDTTSGGSGGDTVTPPPPPPDRVGTWQGTTSRDLELSFVVEPDGMRSVSFAWDLPFCSGTLETTSDPPRAIAGDTFTFRTTPVPGNLGFTLSGGFDSATTASGTLTFQALPLNVPGVPSCSGSASLTWTAELTE
jgi:hypothetical protein